MSSYFIKISLLWMLLVWSVFSYAQTAKYSNEFMALGVGARAFGMSNVAVATVKDVTSAYWNPAGLLGVKSDLQLAGMHSAYFAGLANYDYVGFVNHTDSNSALGISAIRFAVDDIPNTTQLIDADGNINYDRIKSFTAADYGILISYARKIKGLNLGANAKIIRRIVGDFANSWGFGIDLGGQYTYKKWNFGVMLRDITTTFNAWNYTLSDDVIDIWTITGNEIPQNSIELTLPKIILGAARNFQIKDKFSLLAEANIDVTTDNKRNVIIKSDPFSLDPHLGIELNYGDFIFLRGGVGNVQFGEGVDGHRVTYFQPNFGVGLKYKGIALDYALTDIGDNAIGLYSNVFSLTVDINNKNR